jgi:hypothetical protein
VQADGTAAVEPHRPAAAPPVDCFYAYPTVSGDPVPNSDMTPGPEEIGTTLAQAAPFTGACRVFAPMYRQVPFTAATTPGFTEEQGRAALEVAYQDVRDAFRHYVANDSHGRPFVLIGHSQGGMHLARLIQEEIDGVPALRRRLVSALLIGTTTLAVPEGRAVGGTFDHVPLCQAARQTGCLVAYSSYRADEPPGADAWFGRAPAAGMVVPCVNPAAPAGGRAPLRSYWWGDGAFSPAGPYAEPARNAQVTTSRYAAPGLTSAECTRRDGASYLAVTVHAEPADPRMDDIGGRFFIPGFGLHVLDVDLAIGDLVALVDNQSDEYVRCHGPGSLLLRLRGRCPRW